jgi:small subunit ribosomal protein S1
MEESHAGTTTASSSVVVTDATDTRSSDFFAQLLAEQGSYLRALKYGDIVEGTILRVEREELIVDIGAKSEGVVTARDMHTVTDAERDEIQVGASVLVFVVQPEDEQGRIVLSLDRARQERSWRVLQELADSGEIIEATIVNYNKGGLLVNLDGVRGFIPTSQISGIGRGTDVQKQADMARRVGSTVRLKVIEMSRARNRLILSERQANSESRDLRKGAILSEIAVNETRDGVVTSVCDFGVFVDIGGADGLVHLSELSWSRVRHPGDVFQVGDQTKVLVLSIDKDSKRIALSVKRTQTEPWSTVASLFSVGQILEGVVTQKVEFGAFVRLGDGIEGLIHISELNKVGSDTVKEGDTVTVRIARIDAERRRVGLSLQITPDAEQPASE